MLLLATVVEDKVRHQDEITDGVLVEVAEGNQQAFEELYCTTGRAVYAYALTLLKDPVEAEDVMQDTFLKIRSAASLYHPMGKPMAWILTITRNICLMNLRQQKHRSYFSSEDVQKESILDQISDLEDRLVLETAFQLLSDEECQIIVLHAVTGWKHREIAQLLHIPLSTVLSKYRRGLNKLRKELEGKL